jgi:hypothetical protein
VQATANSTAGEYTVTASAPGLAVAASFALRNGAAVPAAPQPVPLGGWGWLLASGLGLWGMAGALRQRRI